MPAVRELCCNCGANHRENEEAGASLQTWRTDRALASLAVGFALGGSAQGQCQGVHVRTWAAPVRRTGTHAVEAARGASFRLVRLVGHVFGPKRRAMRSEGLARG